MLWPIEARINLHTGEQNNIQNNAGLSNFEQRYFPDEPGAGHLTFLFVFKPKTLGGRLREGWSLLELTDAPGLWCITLAMCATKEKFQVFSFWLNRSPWVRKSQIYGIYIYWVPCIYKIPPLSRAECLSSARCIGGSLFTSVSLV